MTTLRSAWLACILCALAATAASGQGPTGALSSPKNDSRQQREDSLKADEARKSGEMGTRPSASPDTPAALGLNTTNPVQGIQAALKAHGHDPGPIDGVMGRRTQDALRAYQTTQHLKVTGRIDEATLDKLGIQLGARNP